MGLCDDIVEVHEPPIRASVEGHSCLEVEPKVLHCSENGWDLVDSGTVLAGAQNQCLELSGNYDAISLSGDGVGTAVGGMPVGAVAGSGSGDRLVSRKLLGDECGVSGDCLNNGNADCVCSSDGIETELVNRLTELAGESENVVCLVSGKLLADECGDSGDCSNEEQGKNLDSSVENDGSCVDKQGFTGESNGLVGSLESSESSSQLSFVSDSLRKDCQRNDNEDEKSIVVQEVMEEKSNYSAGIGTADDEKTAPLVGCEMHPKLKGVSCSSTVSTKQDEQNCVASLESVIEERGADLDGLESNNPVVLGDSVPEDKQKDDQIKTILKSSPEGVLEFVNEAAHVLTRIETAPNQVVSSLAPENFLELRPLVGLPQKVVDEDAEKDNSPVSAPRDEGVMEMPNDVSSRIETVSSHNISASSIINVHLQSFTQQNELDTHNTSGSAFETDLEQKSDNSIRSKVDMCTQMSQHGGEIPTESMQTVCQIIGPRENDVKNGKGINFVTVERTPEEIEESSAAEGYVQALPLQDSQSTFENTTFDDSVNNVLQQNEQCNDKHFDSSSTKSLSGVVEEKRDIKTEIKVEIIGCKDRNVTDHKEGSDEMPRTSFADKTFSPESCQTLIVDENGSSKSSHPLGKGIKHSISFSNTVDCPGQTDIRVEDEDRIYCDSETNCDDLIPTYFQRSSQTTKIIWKPQTKKAARKCRKKPTAANLNESIDTILKAPRSKRSLNSNPARSNIWGSSYTNFFELSNELKLNHVQNNGLRKSKIGRGHRKKTSSRVGGSSRRKSRENRSSTSCIRLKVKVGKEICQNSLYGTVPEVIDSSASTDAANATSGSKDKIGEKSAKMQLKCHDNKPGVVDTCSDASLLNLHQASRGLEGTLTSENPAGDAAEHYLGVSDHIEAERLEAVIEKRYTDPGTSPDSEVINAISEGQVGAACQEDFAEAILISKTGVTAPNVTTGKKGKKKDRNPCSDNCFKKDRSSDAANKSKTKPRKKCQDGQRKDESVCSSEILTSSTSVIASPQVTEYGVPKEALMVDMNTEIKTHSDLDVDLDMAGSQNLKNGLPSIKSKVRQKKSDREGKRTSKLHDPDRSKKKNGCRQMGNERKVVNKKNAKEKTVSNQVNQIDDDSERGNHTIDENGKTDAADNAITMPMGMANLDLASSHVLDENLPVESAWVHCDVCHKWRRIPVSLVDSIGQTNCQWICKGNMDKAFADCSIPQEKSNAEINAELGISDIDEDAYDVPLNSRGLDSMRDRGSKEYEFARISTNQFLHRSRKTQTIDEIMVCHCQPPLNGGLGCGDECLNRMLNIECVRGTCPCGDLCSNQQFQKRSYAKMRWDRCGKKGFGLQLEEDISKGQFLIEYVGEVLDMNTYEARQKEYASKGHKHFYFMTLDGSEVIDACAKGNLGRFINHSCDPNCRTEKWVVNGEICIGLFALRDIKRGEEVTFDYNYVRVFGAAAKKCYCGSSQCRGYIGGDPSNTEIIDQVDSDEEFPEPVMIEEVQGRNGHQNKLPRRSSSDGVEMQIAENILKNRDKMDNYRKPVGKLEVMHQSAASTSLLDSSVEISDIKTGVPSSSEAVKASIQVDDSSKTTSSVRQDISLEETTEKPSSSSQSLEASPNVNSKASSDGSINKKSKSCASEEKRIFVKSRFRIKTSRQPGSVKKENSTVSFLKVNKSQISANKSQVVLVKSKKLMEGASNVRFEAVEEKLNELLDSDGGISKRKDAPKGYLKLLLHTAASGANKNGEAIQSNRDLSMILDALLKTKSRVVLVDIIEKNGLRMLHNMLKVYRRDFKKTPILRKLLKVLEYLANRQILTSEHIHGDAPCPGMESFRESMLSLTEHDDKQVHQIARSFRDRWFPRNIRKFSHMDRDERRMEFNSGSDGNRASASHNNLYDQGAKPAVTVDSVMQSRVGTTLDTPVQEVSSAPSSAIGSTRTRKRKSRWDQPAEEKPVSLQQTEQKVGSMLPQQSESNACRDTANKEDASCPHCYLNYCLQKEARRVEDGSQNILEDAPPGFSSPHNGSLASSSTSSTVADIRQQDNSLLDGMIGHPRSKFNSHLPVSYGIPMPIVQQFGSFNADNESWIIAPGVPFHPFPPLPPFPQKRKETLPCTATRMSIDENAGRQQDSCVPANFHASENSPSTTRSNQPDMHFRETNNQQVLKRPREFSNDLGRRYFRQQKCNLPPWVRKRNGWDT